MPTTYTAIEALTKNEAFSRLQANIKQLILLEKELLKLLPEHLKESVKPAALRDKKLTVFIVNNAFASRVRHIEPTLIRELQQRGWPIEKITVRVNPNLSFDKVREKEAKLSEAGRQALSLIRQTLSSQ